MCGRLGAVCEGGVLCTSRRYPPLAGGGAATPCTLELPQRACCGRAEPASGPAILHALAHSIFRRPAIRVWTVRLASRAAGARERVGLHRWRRSPRREPQSRPPRRRRRPCWRLPSDRQHPRPRPARRRAPRRRARRRAEPATSRAPRACGGSSCYGGRDGGVMGQSDGEEKPFPESHALRPEVPVHRACRMPHMLPFQPRPTARLLHSHGKCIQGNNGASTHRGTLSYGFDFLMDVGSPVLAARKGVVAAAVQHFGEGGGDSRFAPRANFVAIRHGDGSYSRYYHLKKNGVLVRVGERVSAGQPIALSGNTGFTGERARARAPEHVVGAPRARRARPIPPFRLRPPRPAAPPPSHPVPPPPLSPLTPPLHPRPPPSRLPVFRHPPPRPSRRRAAPPLGRRQPPPRGDTCSRSSAATPRSCCRPSPPPSRRLPAPGQGTLALHEPSAAEFARAAARARRRGRRAASRAADQSSGGATGEGAARRRAPGSARGGARRRPQGRDDVRPRRRADVAQRRARPRRRLAASLPHARARASRRRLLTRGARARVRAHARAGALALARGRRGPSSTTRAWGRALRDGRLGAHLARAGHLHLEGASACASCSRAPAAASRLAAHEAASEGAAAPGVPAVRRAACPPRPTSACRRGRRARSGRRRWPLSFKYGMVRAAVGMAEAPSPSQVRQGAAAGRTARAVRHASGTRPHRAGPAHPAAAEDAVLAVPARHQRRVRHRGRNGAAPARARARVARAADMSPGAGGHGRTKRACVRVSVGHGGSLRDGRAAPGSATWVCFQNLSAPAVLDTQRMLFLIRGPLAPRTGGGPAAGGPTPSSRPREHRPRRVGRVPGSLRVAVSLGGCLGASNRTRTRRPTPESTSARRRRRPRPRRPVVGRPWRSRRGSRCPPRAPPPRPARARSCRREPQRARTARRRPRPPAPSAWPRFAAARAYVGSATSAAVRADRARVFPAQLEHESTLSRLGARARLDLERPAVRGERRVRAPRREPRVPEVEGVARRRVGRAAAASARAPNASAAPRGRRRRAPGRGSRTRAPPLAGRRGRGRRGLGRRGLGRRGARRAATVGVAPPAAAGVARAAVVARAPCRRPPPPPRARAASAARARAPRRSRPAAAAAVRTRPPPPRSPRPPGAALRRLLQAPRRASARPRPRYWPSAAAPAPRAAAGRAQVVARLRARRAAARRLAQRALSPAASLSAWRAKPSATRTRTRARASSPPRRPAEAARPAARARRRRRRAAAAGAAAAAVAAAAAAGAAGAGARPRVARRPRRPRRVARHAVGATAGGGLRAGSRAPAVGLGVARVGPRSSPRGNADPPA